ncbi:MAG: hypothetical protein MJ064_01760 [Lachnospiraceae bacterium]|nr:hypothetical protein [Lachnospiraceae bacterium]
MKRICVVCLILACVLAATGCGLLPQEESKRKTPVNKTSVETQYFTVVEAARGDVADCFTAQCSYGTQKVENLAFKVQNERIWGLYVKNGDYVYEGEKLAELYHDDLDEEIEAAEEICKNLDEQFRYYQKMVEFETERQKLAKNYGRKFDTSNLESLTISRDDYAGQKMVADLKLAEINEKLKGRVLTASFDGVVTYVREMNRWEGVNLNTFITVQSTDTGFITIIDGSQELFTVGEVYNLDTADGVIACELKSMTQNKTILNRYHLVFVPIQSDLTFASGEEGTLKIVLKESKDVIYIPTEALRTIDDRNAVYVVGQDGLRELRYVEVGLSVKGAVPTDLNRTEIKSGLSEGEQVIIR